MTSDTRDKLALQIKLIANEAAKRLADGEILSSTVAGASSDSAYLLELLAFELLLKATLQVNAIKPVPSHSYSKLFTSLPCEVQERVRDVARSRVGPEVDFSGLHGLLDTWGRNFVNLRYPYEKYRGLTEDEYRARGDAWLQKGGNENAADFVYYPEQLYALTHALRIEVDTWLRDQG